MATKFYDGGLASGSNNGSSWENAYRTFQAAVDGCGAGDDVWGKANSETLSATVDIDIANVPNFYGGFATALTGTNGSVAGRDLVANVTTLNGNSAVKILAITRNCTFSGWKFYNGDDTPGGASVAGTISVTFDHCQFDTNQGSFQGGALLLTSATAVTIDDCIFHDNFGAQYGAAIHSAITGTLTVRRCTFDGNVAVYEGGCFNKSAAGAASFEDCTFKNSDVTTGIYGGGGACHVYGGTTVWTRCKFTDNLTHADAWGGAIKVDGSGVVGRTTNCIFSGNHAAYGGAVICVDGTYQATNCTFSANHAVGGDGGAISAYGTTTVVNCIVYGNEADGSNDQIDNGGATPGVTYSDVQGAYTGTGNINVNPNFLGSGNDPYNLGSLSNVVDSGNAGATYYPTTDYLGQARVDYPGHTGTGTGTPAYSDMGAYELQAPVVPATGAPLLLLFN